MSEYTTTINGRRCEVVTEGFGSNFLVCSVIDLDSMLEIEVTDEIYEQALSHNMDDLADMVDMVGAL